jgi:hypothetical protein
VLGEVNQFKINSDNSLLLQTWQLPASVCSNKGESLQLKATGSGIALVQSIITFNLPEVIAEPSFTLTQIFNEEKSTKNRLSIQTCVQYHDGTGNDLEEAGMSIVESTLLGGFVASQSELDSLVESKKESNILKMVEVTEDNKVAFYLNHLNGEPFCFEWEMKREFFVANAKPVPVEVYDYYRPNLRKIFLFSPPADSSDVCDFIQSFEGCL